MLIIATLSVALVTFIIYALERRSKNEPIVWENAIKLSLFGGLITSGIVFVSTTDVVKETVTSIEVPSVQEMFVGTPSF